MSELALSAIALTLKVATVSTLVTVIPAVVLAYWFARRDTFASRLTLTLLSLPMVLPPTAVGYLLLRLIAVDGPLGPRVLGLDIDILLTWKAAVLAASVMAFPIVVRTAKVAFDGVDPRLEDMSRTLGHGPIRTFFNTTLPLATRGVLAAVILGFTRAAGEFGATVTIAGNIPNRTQTLASAIYSSQQMGRSEEAVMLIIVALALGFAAIFSTEMLVRRARRDPSKQ